jgi:hypothetical protein
MPPEACLWYGICLMASLPHTPNSNCNDEGTPLVPTVSTDRSDVLSTLTTPHPSFHLYYLTFLAVVEEDRAADTSVPHTPLVPSVTLTSAGGCDW